MSYWSHNPELLDEITIASLPDKWKDKIEAGEIELEDVPEKIRDKAMLEGEREFWANKIDSAKMLLKERRLARALASEFLPKETEEEHKETKGEEDPFEPL